MEIKNKKLFLLGTFGVAIVVSLVSSLIVVYVVFISPYGERIRNRLNVTKTDSGITIKNTVTDKVVLEESSAFIDGVKNITPAVVSITGQGQAVQNIFGYGTIEAPKVSGTGFIITSDGLIVTNKHVASIQDGSYTVTTSEGKNFDAKVVATDPTNDIALLKVEQRGLPVADLGDSDKLEIGQWVIAVGNALGELQNTVTVGVISAKERTASPSDGNGKVEYLDGLLQTDAAINSGNSGGPLVNIKGQVIGINTAVAGSAQNIGFAIPIADVKTAIDSYKASGKIIRPYMGVRHQSVTKALAKALGLSVEQGALLTAGGTATAVQAGSPAEKAGLKTGDIIIKVNEDNVTETQPLTRLIRKYQPNQEVTLTIVRQAKEIKLKLTLGQSSN